MSMTSTAKASTALKDAGQEKKKITARRKEEQRKARAGMDLDKNLPALPAGGSLQDAGVAAAVFKAQVAQQEAQQNAAPTPAYAFQAPGTPLQTAAVPAQPPEFSATTEEIAPISMRPATSGLVLGPQAQPTAFSVPESALPIVHPDAAMTRVIGELRKFLNIKPQPTGANEIGQEVDALLGRGARETGESRRIKGIEELIRDSEKLRKEMMDFVQKKRSEPENPPAPPPTQPPQPPQPPSGGADQELIRRLQGENSQLKEDLRQSREQVAAAERNNAQFQAKISNLESHLTLAAKRTADYEDLLNTVAEGKKNMDMFQLENQVLNGRLETIRNLLDENQENATEQEMDLRNQLREATEEKSANKQALEELSKQGTAVFQTLHQELAYWKNKAVHEEQNNTKTLARIQELERESVVVKARERTMLDRINWSILMKEHLTAEKSNATNLANNLLSKNMIQLEQVKESIKGIMDRLNQNLQTEMPGVNIDDIKELPQIIERFAQTTNQQLDLERINRQQELESLENKLERRGQQRDAYKAQAEAYRSQILQLQQQIQNLNNDAQEMRTKISNFGTLVEEQSAIINQGEDAKSRALVSLENALAKLSGLERLLNLRDHQVKFFQDKVEQLLRQLQPEQQQTNAAAIAREAPKEPDASSGVSFKKEKTEGGRSKRKFEQSEQSHVVVSAEARDAVQNAYGILQQSKRAVSESGVEDRVQQQQAEVEEAVVKVEEKVQQIAQIPQLVDLTEEEMAVDAGVPALNLTNSPVPTPLVNLTNTPIPSPANFDVNNNNRTG